MAAVAGEWPAEGALTWARRPCKRSAELGMTIECVGGDTDHGGIDRGNIRIPMVTALAASAGLGLWTAVAGVMVKKSTCQCQWKQPYLQGGKY